MEEGEKTKECEVLISFNVKYKDLDKMFQIEKLMREMGIKFDTGFSIPDRRRDWEFDYSLKGAKVYFKRFKNGEKT